MNRLDFLKVSAAGLLSLFVPPSIAGRTGERWKRDFDDAKYTLLDGKYATLIFSNKGKIERVFTSFENSQVMVRPSPKGKSRGIYSDMYELINGRYVLVSEFQMNFTVFRGFRDVPPPKVTVEVCYA